MAQLSTEKMLVVALVLGGVLLGVLFVGSFVVDHIADKVIEKLEKEYSPSPYGPGLNPDRVDVTRFHGRFQRPNE